MEPTRWDDLVVVARVARTHGRRGEVILNLETDFPQERFQPGREFFMLDGPRMVSVTVDSVFFQRGRPVVGLAGVDTMNDAELLAGRELRIRADDLVPLPIGAYYHHDLVGCRVRTGDGTEVGVVRRIEGAGTACRLVVDGPDGEQLIPFAEEICRTIAPADGEIVIDAPDGLLGLNAGRSSRMARRGRRR
ncbi:MAG: ribosome maturation factor RimM [Acidobacteriota bacterium]